MAKRKIILFIAICSILISSCIHNQFTYDDYNSKPYLVINGYIGQQHVIVHLTQLQLMGENNGPDITNSEVGLYSNDELICELITDDDSIYYSPYPLNLNENTDYYIKALSNNIGEAISNPLRIPSKPEFILDTTLYMNPIKFEVHINNDPIERNYYYTKVLAYFDSKPDTIHQFFSPYELIHDNHFMNHTLDTILEYRVDHGVPDSIDLVLYNLSSEINQFAESIEKYEDEQEVFLVRTQVDIYSNIENGYGVITACNSDTIKIRY